MPNDERAWNADGRWLLIVYVCPRCERTWEDEWSCAVDAECPSCDTRHVEPFDWEDNSQAAYDDWGPPACGFAEGVEVVIGPYGTA